MLYMKKMAARQGEKMNTCIYFDEKPFPGEDEQNFAALVQPMLDSWLPAFRSFEAKPGKIDEILPILGHAALMAWLPAKNNIAVEQSVIESFREIFKIARHKILENPDFPPLSDRDRASLERANMRLAKAITILDLANDPGIAELFPCVKR